MSPSDKTGSSAARKIPTSIWQVYNKQAESRDEALVKSWFSSLDSLLLFAGIFSAVLTALCVESQKLLQEDPLDSINNLMKFMVARELNATTPFHSPSPFEPYPWAVRVNGCFFASLTSSMVAAMGAVTCLQWVGEYDVDLEDASKIEDRALRSHYRFRATREWLMTPIIAMLPIFLYISVILFFVGLVIWFWHVNQTIALIPLVGVLFWASTYMITTLLAVFFPSAPFKTPLSRALFRGFYLAYFYTWRAAHIVPIFVVESLKFSIHFFKFRSKDFRKYKQQFIINRVEFYHRLQLKQADAFPWIPPDRDHKKAMHARVWEKVRVGKDVTLPLASLAWLANSLEISEHTKHEFKLLLLELNQMSPEKLAQWPHHIQGAPWGHIFNLVLTPDGNSGPRRDSVAGAKNDFTQLMVKMANHPKLFRRMVRELTSDVLATLVGQLPQSAPPASKLEAKHRLKSITAVLNSWQWEHLDASQQPIYPAICSILQCLEVLHTNKDKQHSRHGHRVIFEGALRAVDGFRSRPGLRRRDSNLLEPFKEPDESMFMVSTSWIFTLCKTNDRPQNPKKRSHPPALRPTSTVSVTLVNERPSIFIEFKNAILQLLTRSPEQQQQQLSWPDPTFNPDGFEIRPLRESAIMRYLEFIDANISSGESIDQQRLPFSRMEWRWHLSTTTPTQGSRAAMLQLLTEYLLPIMTRMDEAHTLGIRNSRDMLEEFATKCTSKSLREVIRYFTMRHMNGTESGADSIASNKLGFQGPTVIQNDPRLKDETWIYVWEMCFGLHDGILGTDDLSGPTFSIDTSLEGVLVTMITSDQHPLLQEAIRKILERHVKHLASRFWQSLLESLSNRDDEVLKSYSLWMLKAPRAVYFDVCSGFMSHDYSHRENPVLEALLQQLIPLRPGLTSNPSQPMSPTVPDTEDRIDKALLGFTRVVVAVGEPHYSPLLHLLEEIHHRIHSFAVPDETESSQHEKGTWSQLESALTITSFVSTEFDRIPIRERDSVKRELVNIAQEAQSAAEGVRENTTEDNSQSSAAKRVPSTSLSIEYIQEIIDAHLREILSAKFPMSLSPASQQSTSGSRETPKLKEIPIR